MRVPSPWLIVDLFFAVAERVDRFNERRRERRSIKREAKARGLPWKDVARQRAMAASSARPAPAPAAYDGGDDG